MKQKILVTLMQVKCQLPYIKCLWNNIRGILHHPWTELVYLLKESRLHLLLTDLLSKKIQALNEIATSLELWRSVVFSGMVERKFFSPSIRRDTIINKWYASSSSYTYNVIHIKYIMLIQMGKLTFELNTCCMQSSEIFLRIIFVPFLLCEYDNLNISIL